MTVGIHYSQRAASQLDALYEWIAADSGLRRADTFVGAIVDYCDGLELFPLRGHARGDILPGLRLLGFRRRVTIAYTVEREEVTILGIFYGGQNVETALRDTGNA